MKKIHQRTEPHAIDHQRSLEYLAAMNLPPELENMPHTGASIHLSGKVSLPASRTMKFLHKKAHSSIWTNHLVFVALVMAGGGMVPKSVHSILLTLSKVLHDYQSDLVTCDEIGQPIPHLTIENVTHVFKKIAQSGSMSDNNKADWYMRYQSCSNATSAWFARHCQSLGFDKHFYEQLLLPTPTDFVLNQSMTRLRKKAEFLQKSRRKEETNELFPNTRLLYAQANIRLNLFERFYDAAKQAEAYAIENELVTYRYNYEQDGTVVHCQIVNISYLFDQFVANGFDINEMTPEFYERGGSAKFQRKHYYVEMCNADELDREKFWFIELLEAHVFYDKNSVTKKKFEAFCRAYNYTDGYLFRSYLTRVSHMDIPRNFISVASERLNRLFVPHHEMRLIFNMGSLATEFCLTSGARINEVLQIAAHPDVLKKLTIPRIEDPTSYLERYAVMLIPKGRDEPEPFFLTDSTFDSLNHLCETAADNNLIYEEQKVIHSILPHQDNAKYHLLEKRPYLFQVDGKHLTSISLSTAMKLVLHNIAVRNSATGKLEPIKIKAHVFRHLFATYSVNVEKVPIDVVAKMMNQKYLPVTKYYAEPTLSVVAHHHERIGENLFHSLNLEVESKRLPDEMVTLYETAKSTSGTLTEVLGGTCTSHGQCPAKTACVGCAAKVPDPAKRAVIERKMEWALNEKTWNHENGFGAEERKMDVLIRDCKTELMEMEQIQIYMQSRGEAVQVFDSEHVPLKWVGNSGASV